MKNTPVDYILLGLLNLLFKIISATTNTSSITSNEMAKLVFSKCLFSLDAFSTVKCKSQDSRKVAFKLLYALLKNDQSSHLKNFINNELLSLASRIPQLNNWNYLPATEMRS